jgi:hypothetical protein
MSRQLFVVCIYDKGALIGIAPFMISRCKVYWKNFREVNFIGTRWEVDRPGFLFTGSSEECGEVAAKVLIAYRRRWDLMKFHEQDTDNPALAAFLDELGRQGILLGTTIDSVCPHLKLQGTWADFLAGKSQKFRKNLKAARRKLERAGRLEYGRFSGDSGRLHGLLKEYETLELSSRKAKAGVRVVSNPEYFHFYRDIVEKFSDRGQFIFRSLRLDGRLIAATFGLEFQRVYYSLQISHDDAFSQFSPGSLLESIELEECFAADLNEYDFLGGFLNNKRRWTTTARKTKQVYGYRPLFNFRLIYLVYFQVKPTLKNWLGRVGVGFHGGTQGTSQ